MLTSLSPWDHRKFIGHCEYNFTNRLFSDIFWKEKDKFHSILFVVSSQFKVRTSNHIRLKKKKENGIFQQQKKKQKREKKQKKKIVRQKFEEKNENGAMFSIMLKQCVCVAFVWTRK